MHTYCSTSKRNYIYSGGKVVGRVENDTLHKTIRGSKHFLRKPPAIALDLAALDQAEQAGASRVEVVDVETGTRYRATIDHIREAGFQFDRGYGEQIGLELDGWVRFGPRGEQLDFIGGRNEQ